MAQVQLDAVAVRLDPERVAAAREEPRDRRVVPLRDAAHLEHVGRAVGSRVAPVGTEPHVATRLVELLTVARAEAGEALAGPRLPVGAEPERARLRREPDRHALVLQPEAHHAELAAQNGVALRDHRAHVPRRPEPPRPLELLRREHALGELDELVAGLAGRGPEPHAPDLTAPAADLDGERIEGHGHAQRAVVEGDRRGHRPLVFHN
jgi:hypothetical protein